MALKDEVLRRLRNARSPVSGQELAGELGVSRSAVWKAVNALRRSGYEIDSATNRGYSLLREGDALSAETISRLLEDKTLPVYVLETVDSTSSECRRLLASGVGRCLVLARQQSGGRGRNGRAFFSPPDSGLYMSAALRLGMSHVDAVGITTYAAVCVAGAIRDLTGLEVGVKWVNDVYYRGKKVCGILTEAVSSFEDGQALSAIVGIGVNLHPSAVPEELRDIVGFLNCGAVKNELAAEIINRLLRYDPRQRGYIDEYRALSVVLGRRISYVSGGAAHSGVAVDIDPSGGLVVQTGDIGRVTLNSGEISLTSVEGLNFSCKKK